MFHFGGVHIFDHFLTSEVSGGQLFARPLE
jgi:hypothetical protein